MLEGWVFLKRCRLILFLIIFFEGYHLYIYFTVKIMSYSPELDMRNSFK